jgi:hypothetical protein
MPREQTDTMVSMKLTILMQLTRVYLSILFVTLERTRIKLNFIEQLKSLVSCHILFLNTP